MQKQKVWLKLSVLILTLVYSSLNEYSSANVNRNSLYPQFKHLAENKQRAKAIEIGHDLFKSLTGKYPENVSLQDLQNRLESANDLAELITQSLEQRQKKLLTDIADLDILPELPPIGKQKEEPVTLLAPPERLYWANLYAFSNEPNVEGITTPESDFLREYYDLKMQALIEKVINTVTRIAITDSASSDICCYSLVLPLLYMSDNDLRWENMHSLFETMGSDTLDILSDFCLLRLKRPETATAVAKYKAKLKGEDFSPVDWSLGASDKCTANNQPYTAEKLLLAAIEDTNDENRIIELRLEIAENYGKCGNIAGAVEKCEQIAEDFPDSPLYGKVMFSYFAYLSKQSEAEKVLAEIDSALKAPHCKAYLPQLMYIKWWALRKTNQQTPANRIGEHLIEKYGHNKCIAPVLLANATDALSSQQYELCRRLLLQLTRNFPQTRSAKQAQEILTRLGEK